MDYYQRGPPEESVYQLLPPEVYVPPKEAMYRSKVRRVSVGAMLSRRLLCACSILGWFRFRRKAARPLVLHLSRG